MNHEQSAEDPQQDLTRPARKQVPGPVTHGDSGHAAAGSINLWSGRQLGPRGANSSRVRGKQQSSAYRCKPKLDAGKTKGSQGNVNTFCLFFAKGMCYQGSDCPYLHRLPTSADDAAMARNIQQDVFGREKMPVGQERKKGAGSYELDMTTLYVHYGGAGHYAVPQLRHLLLQDFGEFGPVKGIHIVPAKTIAFVKYHWRVSAEFAREALDQQQLTGSTLHEVLAVRWAYDDPNPAAVVSRKRSALDAVEAAAMSAWEALPPAEKQARIALAQQARAQRVSAVASAIPAELLAASEGEVAQGDIPDNSFDVWRGFTGRQHPVQLPDQQQAAHAVQDTTAIEGQQWASEQVQALADSWNEHPAEAAEQQMHAAAAEDAGAAGAGTAGGSWFQGWRQRHKPSTFADELAMDTAAAAAAAGSAAPHVVSASHQAAGEGSTAGQQENGLGLLAGYGSGSESEREPE